MSSHEFLASDDRYRSIFDAIADPLFVYDRETLAYLAVNAAAVRTYGYSTEEFLGMTVKDIRPVEDVSALLAMLSSAGSALEDRGVWRHCRKDGTVLEMEILAHGLEYGGRPACVIQARDVSRRRRIEAEAAQSHALLRAVADGMSDAVFVKDRAGRYLLFNEAASRYVGKPAADVLGKDDTVVFEPESAQVVMGHDRLVMESDGVHLSDDRLTASGVTRVYEAIRTPYRDASGAVLGVIGVAREITDRRREEAARHQQQTLLRIAGRIARLGGWSIDLVAQQVTWSDEVCAIHDEPPGYGPPVSTAISYYLPDYRPLVSQAVGRCIEDGTPFDLECELRTARGRQIWVRAIGEAVRGVHGRITGVHGALQDITDRKRAEEELRQVAGRLATTLESIADGFFTMDRDWRFTYVNAEAEKLVRRDRDSLLGTTLWDAFPEASGSVFEREFRRAIAEKNSLGFEQFFAPLRKWFAVRVYPSEQGCTVYFRDVTASHEAQREVRLSEERFRLVSKAISDVVWETDLVTGTQSWNEGLTTLFGYDASEIEPTIDFATRLIHPEDVDGVAATVERALTSGAESWSAEYRFRRRDGDYTPILNSGYIIRDDAGQPTRMLGGMKDLTERRRSEASLLLRDRAIQAASQGILVTDANQPDNPIVFVSGGFERITGYTAAEVTGRNCRFLQGAATDADTVDELRTAIAAPRSCSVEVLNYRKDGTPFWNELSITPVRDAAGQLTHFVGVQTDVTQRRKLEDQYRQAQKMEAVGRLAGGVAHDFNNLLTIISGYTELLLAMPAMDAVVRDSIVSISEASEQAASLTRQLLGFSRKSLMQPKVLDLNTVIARTSEMLRRLIGEDIILTTVLDQKVSAVRMDPSQLDQVLMNLAVNARDAMPSGGKLTIETGNAVITADDRASGLDCQPGPHVMVAMSDTGSGMAPEVMARIFEPFYTTKSVGRGTGLGLSMVFGIVEQSGGCLRVDSEPGRGSTFRMYLPAVGEPPVVETRDDTRSSVEGTETVLLVEDADGVRTLAMLSLQMHGYTVLPAVDGRDALRVVEGHRGQLHLVLTDVVMPRIGGPALVERLKADAPGLKVLFVSGYTDDAAVRHGLIEAEMDFIQKPYTPLSLVRKVRQVLDRPSTP